jgi:hypothetical protein
MHWLTLVFVVRVCLVVATFVECHGSVGWLLHFLVETLLCAGQLPSPSIVPNPSNEATTNNINNNYDDDNNNKEIDGAGNHCGGHGGQVTGRQAGSLSPLLHTALTGRRKEDSQRRIIVNSAGDHCQQHNRKKKRQGPLSIEIKRA